MNLIEILRADYARFPADQTYAIYDPEVYFKDPLNEFRGRDRYERTIQFIATWFRDVVMELHQIQQTGDRIETEWTLHWTSPLPWQPRITIPGRSELHLAGDRIIAHIDIWHCSRLHVLQQHFSPARIQ